MAISIPGVPYYRIHIRFHIIKFYININQALFVRSLSKFRNLLRKVIYLVADRGSGAVRNGPDGPKVSGSKKVEVASNWLDDSYK